MRPPEAKWGDRNDAGGQVNAWWVLFAFGALYLCWGSTYLAIRVAIETVPPFAMACGRFVVAGAILYVVLRGLGQPAPAATTWRNQGLIGCLLLAGGNGAVTWAEQMVPSGIVALVVAATPLWLTLMDWARGSRVRPSLGMVVALFVGFAGVSLIVVGRSDAGDRIVQPIAALVLAFGTFCWAAGSIYSRSLARTDIRSTFMAIAIQMLSAGGLLGVVAVFSGDWGRLAWHAVSGRSFAAWGYLVVAGSWIGYSAYIWLLQVCPPARVGTYAYVNPVVAIFLGAVVAGEPLPGTLFIASFLILGSVVAITRFATTKSATALTAEDGKRNARSL